MPAADLHVATNGNDAWSGTLAAPNAEGTDGPLATLHRARDAARALEGAVRILVRGGTYYLAEPLVLGPDDSGTAEHPAIYSAYPDEQVVLSGGRPITGWKQGKGGLWVADVPDKGWNFRQLFVGGERQTRARTPDADPKEPYTGGFAFATQCYVKGKAQGSFGTTLARIHTPGDTFLWEVDVPADGEYTVWLYYGALNKPHGSTTMAGRTTMQADNGEPVTLQNLPDTGGWGTFAWKKTATLKLQKGTRRIRWTNVKGGGLNFDAFALSSDPAWEPKGTKLAPNPRTAVVQAETYVSYKAKEFALAKGRGSHPRNKLYFREGDIRAWPRSPEPEIHIFPAWGWVNSILSVDRVNLDARTVHVKNRNCSQEIRPGNRYFVENVFEALDEPGEWFLDRAQGRLYYWPRDPGFDGTNVVAPRLDRMIEIGDAEHIVVRGFTFRHTTYSLEMGSVYSPDDGAVHLRGSRHCIVEGCEFLGIGGYAVRLSEKATGNHILSNRVVEAGQGGVLLIGADTANQPTDNVVAGNRIHHCGRIWKHVAGVYVTTGSGNRIVHNTITDVPRYGISLKTFAPGRASHRNVIEFNRIERTNLETNDTGAIETLGRDRQDTGNIIRCNILLDSIGLKTTEDGKILSPFYTWGVYLDDYSSGTRVVGNIIARTYRGGIHVHLGRNNHFENNILVDGQLQQIECNGRVDMVDNTFVRNIVCFRQGNLIRVSGWSDRTLAACDHNLYWKVDGDLTKTEGALTPKGPWAQWLAAGFDRHSVVADPLFVDPAKDDYRLREGSPALKLGFKPIDVSRIGARGYRRPPDLP